MYRNVLVPTDGSKLAARGIKAGVKLAEALGARVTGVYVIPPYTPPMYGEAALYYIPGTSPQEYKKMMEKLAKKALAGIEIEASTAGVACTTQFLGAAHPWDGILKVARAKK